MKQKMKFYSALLIAGLLNAGAAAASDQELNNKIDALEKCKVVYATEIWAIFDQETIQNQEKLKKRITDVLSKLKTQTGFERVIDYVIKYNYSNLGNPKSMVAFLVENNLKNAINVMISYKKLDVTVLMPYAIDAKNLEMIEFIVEKGVKVTPEQMKSQKFAEMLKDVNNIQRLVATLSQNCKLEDTEVMETAFEAKNETVIKFLEEKGLKKPEVEKSVNGDTQNNDKKITVTNPTVTEVIKKEETVDPLLGQKIGTETQDNLSNTSSSNPKKVEVEKKDSVTSNTEIKKEDTPSNVTAGENKEENKLETTLVTEILKTEQKNEVIDPSSVQKPNIDTKTKIDDVNVSTSSNNTVSTGTTHQEPKVEPKMPEVVKDIPKEITKNKVEKPVKKQLPVNPNNSTSSPKKVKIADNITKIVFKAPNDQQTPLKISTTPTSNFEEIKKTILNGAELTEIKKTAIEKKQDDVSQLINKLENVVVYPKLFVAKQVNEKKTGYDFLTENNAIIKNKDTDISMVSAALSAHVILGGKSSPYTFSGKKASNAEKQTYVNSIFAMAKVKNNDVIAELLKPSEEKLEPIVLTHKFVAAFLYNNAENEFHKTQTFGKFETLKHLVKDEQDFNEKMKLAEKIYAPFIKNTKETQKDLFESN